MATIYTRAGKGSALTWTEGDANITNLNTAKIENIVEDTTPQLGGNLDVNGNNITNSVGDNKVSISGIKYPTTNGSNGNVLTSDGAGNATWQAPAGGGLSNIVEDTTPQLGGNLDVQNYNITTSTTNGDIFINGNGTGNIVLAPSSGEARVGGNFRVNAQYDLRLGDSDNSNYVGFKAPATVASNTIWTLPSADGTSNQVLTTNGSGTLSWSTASGGGTPAGSNQQIQFNNSGAFGASSGLTYDGTSLKCSSGNVESLYSNGDEGGEFRLATAATNTTLSGGSIAIDIYQNRLRIFETGGSTRGVYLDLTGAAASVGSAMAIQGTTASFTTLTSTTSTTLKAVNEGALYDLGTTGGTIAPNVANGNVQKITLNSALTINAFTSPVAGQTLTLIIYGGTSYTSITSTMKFAGGVKTLTGTAGCVDILSVYYDGTNYWASLGKGFA